MLPKTQNLSAFGVSTGVHGLILIVLAMFQMAAQNEQEDLQLETVFNEERIQEEFSRDLEEETEIATELNPISGGVVSTNTGAETGPTVAQVNIETSESLKNPDIQVNVGDITTPGEALLAEDLGDGLVTGETGAIVDGYGAALSRMAQELIRLMRKQKVHVVWLFDESESMRDDQAEISSKFDKIYAELGLAREKDRELKNRGEEILLTTIWSYGEGTHQLTREPTDNLSRIRNAIDAIPVDESGKENMCGAIRGALQEFRVQAQRQKRKLVVVVISDESGDDGEYVDDTILEAKRAKAPVYVLGREAVFGYPFARQRWQDPKYKLWHWVRINRGPETAFPECLQWDGLRNRYDVFNSGFGPYEMVRLARETNGIFFVLPGEEEDLTGPGARERRKYAALDMKEYQPLLLPRKVYADEVKRSQFRRTIFDVIITLNPNEIPLLIPQSDPQLNIREIHYAVEMDKFVEQAQREVGKAARAMALCNQAVKLLQDIQPLRAQEASQRWRANYDLALAQLMSYRVRLFQFLLAIDDHVNNNVQPQKEKSNVWNVRRVKKLREPDERQFERIQRTFNVRGSREDFLARMDEQMRKSEELYDYVQEQHPGTPWARRAQHELSRGFGMAFAEGFRDPNYDRPDIKIPKF